MRGRQSRCTPYLAQLNSLGGAMPMDMRDISIQLSAAPAGSTGGFQKGQQALTGL